MNSDSDPLLRALIDEDPACPDGRSLVALGQLIRHHARPVGSASDMTEDVLSRLNQPEIQDAEQIDALFDGTADTSTAPTTATPESDLGRLSLLMRSTTVQPIDVREKVLAKLRVSSRLVAFVQQADSALERSRRWRVWSMVVAGHVAALLAFTVFEFGFNSPTAPSKTIAIIGSDLGTAQTGTSTHVGPSTSKDPFKESPLVLSLPTHRPATWPDMRTMGNDLFLLRRFPELREESRRVYGMAASKPSVDAALTWLTSQQDPSTGCFGPLTGNESRDLATQSVAVLAQLGEGFGDKARGISARKGLGWLCGHLVAGSDGGGTNDIANVGQVSAGLACLALVEGGLLLNDPALKAQAEECLANLDRGQPVQPGASGLGGFILLAVETAQQGGLHVPVQLLQQSRRYIGRTLPAQDTDIGRLGIASFTRFILGHRGNASTMHEVECLNALVPTIDQAGRADPLGWFFATLAMREAGGTYWTHWGTALQRTLLPLLAQTVDGKAHVDATRVRYGESAGDIFATSLVVLDLQVPYRYLPLASN